MFDFLEPTSISIQHKNYQKFNSEIKIEYSNFNVAIVAAGERENIKWFEQVRKEYLKLRNIETKVLDFGNIITDKNSNLSKNIKEIANFCDKQNITLIVLSENSKIVSQIFRTYSEKNEKISAVFVESKIKFSGQKITSHSDKYLDYFVLNDDLVGNINVIGIQNYLTEKEQLEKLTEKGINVHRLSQLSEDLLYYEPLYRESQIAGISLSAIKYCDSPASSEPQPNGLNALEICKLSYFAGISYNLKILTIYDFIPRFDNRNISAKLLAQIIWHFNDAKNWINKKKGKNKFNSFHISLENQAVDDIELSFVHNTNLDLWSVKLNINNKNFESACSYKDYQEAKKGKLTNRILSMIESCKNK